MDKSHFTFDETRSLVQIVGEYVHRASSYTEKKKIFSKKVWDEIFQIFDAKHPGHSRRSVQSRWDRLKSSYNAWASLQGATRGSSLNRSFLPEVEKLRKKALLATEHGFVTINLRREAGDRR